MIDQKENDLKTVFVPMHGLPLISRGSHEEIVKTYFFNKEIHYVILNKVDFLAVSPFYFNDYSNINFLATTVYRSFKSSENTFQDLVYGPALFIGQNDHEGQYTSVSQETIEVVLNVFTRDMYGVKDVS